MKQQYKKFILSENKKYLIYLENILGLWAWLFVFGFFIIFMFHFNIIVFTAWLLFFAVTINYSWKYYKKYN